MDFYAMGYARVAEPDVPAEPSGGLPMTSIVAESAADVGDGF